MKLHIKKGDTVVVVGGSDKGAKGKVLKIMTDKKRAVVEGVNMVKKHLKKRSEEEKGGIVEIPSAVHISNLMLFCKSCNKPVRSGFKVLDNGSKERICRKCQNQI